MRKLIVPFLAFAALGCASAAKVVTAPVGAAANVATATTGAAAGVATTTVGAAANVATAPVDAVAGAAGGGATRRPAVGGACKDDAAKFCAGVATGIGKCLAQHRSEVSAPCNAVLNSLSKFPNCLEDAARLCPTTTPSSAGLMACLRTQQNDLSEECRQQIGKTR